MTDSTLSDKTASVSLRRAAAEGILWQALSTIYVYAVRLITLILLARLLSPSDFGVAAAGSMVIGFGSLLSSLGVGQALLQRDSIEERHLHTAFWISIGLAFLLCIVTFLGATLFAALVGVQELILPLRVLSLSFIIVSSATVARAILLREMQFGIVARLQAASYTLGYLVVGVLMGISGYGYWALIGAYMTEATITSVGLLLTARHRIRWNLDPEAFKQLVSFGGLQTVAAVLGYVASQVDKFIVARWLGTSSLGHYTRASYLTTLFSSMVDSTVGRVGFAAGARIQNNERSFRQGALHSTGLLMLLLLPIAGVCIVLSPEIVDVFLGKGWQPVVPVLQVFAGITILDSPSRFLQSLILAKGRANLVVFAQISYLVTVAIFVYWGLSYGLVGVSLGVLLATLLSAVLHFSLLCRVANISSLQMRRTLLPVVVCGSMVVSASLLIAGVFRLWHLSSWAVLLFTVGSLLGLVLLLRKPLVRSLGSQAQEWIWELVQTLPFRARLIAIAWLWGKQAGQVR